MTFDNFDAAMLAANPLLLPSAEALEALATDSGPTLDDALREFERAGRAPGAGRAGGGGAMGEEAAPDLWITDAMRHAARPVTVGQAGATGMEPAEPSTEDAIDAAAPRTGAQEPQDHPLIREKLSFAEMGGHMIARQYDSTDYSWEEMSSGDYLWASENFKADVYAGVAQVTAGATSQQQADLLAQAYLNSIGLGSLVHVNGSVTGSNDLIVITAPTTTYHNPINYMPIPSLDQPGFDNFDPPTVYDILDVSAHTIAIEVDTPLTAPQLAAVEKLRLQIELTTAMLNSLPANGIFTFADGRTITVAELRALWARADFLVTDHDYSGLGTASRPGAGAAHRNDGDPVFEVNIDRLTNVFMPMDWSRTLYPLHELAHVTLAGYATTVAMWADGNASDPEHYMNEAFATSLGIAIGQAAGYSWLPLFLSDGPPGEALPLVPLPTFTVPAGGDGGGTGGGGGGGGNVGEQ